MPDPLRVLFLCTHNSARSQMAEALLRRRGEDRFEVASAGTEPADQVHPGAIAALQQAGIRWDGRKPSGLDEALGKRTWDLVITVCDKAREACPRLPGRPVTADWGIPDPVAVAESRQEGAFWDALTYLSRRIDLLCALPDEKLRGLALRTSLAELDPPDNVRNATEEAP